MNTPSIRFKGFTGDWEQRKLGDCCREFKSGSFIPTSDIEESGEYPVFGGNGLRGYASEYNHDGEFALIGRQGALCGNMNYSTGKAYFTEHAVAVQANETANTKFMYYLLDKMNLGQYSGQSAQPGLAVGKLVKLEELFPSVGEQEKIGTYFAKLDNLITLHQRKCDSLKQVKKYMLQKMFPKQGEKVPEIRFAGFTGDWEQRKLGDIGKAKSGIGFPDAEQGGTEGIPFFKVSDMNTEGNENELVVANNYVTEEQINRKKWNVIDDVPAIFFAKVGAAVMLNRKRLVSSPFLLDNNTMAYVFDKSMWNCEFGKTLFETIDLTKLTQVGALPSYNASDIEGIEIIIPKRAEQEIIGKYFKNLDNLITLHQRKSDSLKEIKKFMLQNMFPRE